jgi:UDP-glucuronate 4-epimerase
MGKSARLGAQNGLNGRANSAQEGNRSRMHVLKVVNVTTPPNGRFAMRSLITGVAGFVGFHLAEHLLASGHEVIGIDCFTSYYDPKLKCSNIAGLSLHPRFTFIEGDVAGINLESVVKDIDLIFHLAGQPGVRGGWGNDFATYVHHNVVATQKLLASLAVSPPKKVVVASSSSIYGNGRLPMSEADMPKPISPYGITKLAAEHLCHVYGVSNKIPFVALRYFTVYGPRQRPDMAFHRIIHSIMTNKPVPLYGDGSQCRDFTNIRDVVDASLRAAISPHDGVALNICCGTPISMREVIDIIESIMGKRATIRRLPATVGEMTHTHGDPRQARALLGFAARVGIEDGLREQVSWHLQTGHG